MWIVHQLARIVEAVANSEKIQSRVDEGLNKAKLDQITKTKFHMTLELWELRLPKGTHMMNFGASAK